MKRTRTPLAVLLTALFTLLAAPSFAGDCLRLCDQAFMQSATAQDIRAEIDKGADIGAGDEEGYTPLHWAALLNNVQSVKALLEVGANTEARTKLDLTPLHLAASVGYVEAVKTLLKGGADFHAKADNRITPLTVAIQSSFSESVIALLEAGAEIEHKKESGFSSLHNAAVFGNAATIADLIAHGAGVHIETKTEGGFTPLHFAASLGKEEAVIALLNAGADPNARAKEGVTPLILAKDNDRLTGTEALQRLEDATQYGANRCPALLPIKIIQSAGKNGIPKVVYFSLFQYLTGHLS